MKPEVRATQEAMERHGYIAETPIATVVHLALAMRQPLLVEGDAGVGKTELAKVLAALLGTELIRLQCYEGLDVATALYEWNYQRQLLHLKLAEGGGQDPAQLERTIFGRDYLLERPLLRAITRREGSPVLLVDEVDRSDDGFEAFLLEVLSDFQVTIPELGTVRAEHVPYVVVTSNRTREIGDALRRRCLYLYIEHPTLQKEVRIIRAKVPGVSEQLAGQIGRFMQALRKRQLSRMPGVAETLDWARALIALHRDRLDAVTVEETLGCVIKDGADFAELGQEHIAALLAETAAA